MEYETPKINVVLLTMRSTELCKTIIESALCAIEKVDGIIFTVAYGGTELGFENWLKKPLKIKIFELYLPTDF